MVRRKLTEHEFKQALAAYRRYRGSEVPTVVEVGEVIRRVELMKGTAEQFDVLLSTEGHELLPYEDGLIVRAGRPVVKPVNFKDSYLEYELANASADYISSTTAAAS